MTVTDICQAAGDNAKYNAGGLSGERFVKIKVLCYFHGFAGDVFPASAMIIRR